MKKKPQVKIKKKKKDKPMPEETLVDEKEILEEIDNHHLTCSCKTDPKWCPVHSGWY